MHTHKLKSIKRHRWDRRGSDLNDIVTADTRKIGRFEIRLKMYTNRINPIRGKSLVLYESEKIHRHDQQFQFIN